MAHVMPQEIEVWYLIPALRKEVAKVLVKDFELSQKESAKILGITESAVSQYLKSKRGSEINFSEEDIKKIKESTKKMIRDDKRTMKYLYDLCLSLRSPILLCDLHKRHDKNVSKECNVCFDQRNVFSNK